MIGRPCRAYGVRLGLLALLLFAPAAMAKGVPTAN